MFNLFTENERKAVILLAQRAIDKASESLSSLVKSEVKVDGLGFGILDILNGLSEYGLKESENFKVLKNELFGEISGTSILILDQSNTTNILQACLSNETQLDDGPDEKLLIEELLKETGNIVTASLADILANDLDINLHGDDPELYHFAPLELKSFVNEELSKHDYVIHFKSHLKILDMDFSPDFIWILEKSFIQIIKHINTANKENEEAFLTI